MVVVGFLFFFFLPALSLPFVLVFINILMRGCLCGWRVERGEGGWIKSDSPPAWGTPFLPSPPPPLPLPALFDLEFVLCSRSLLPLPACIWYPRQAGAAGGLKILLPTAHNPCCSGRTIHWMLPMCPPHCPGSRVWGSGQSPLAPQHGCPALQRCHSSPLIRLSFPAAYWGTMGSLVLAQAARPRPCSWRVHRC